MKFTDLPLSEEVLAGIEKAGFTDCTPVQETVLPVSLSGRDVMVQSKTGSGKTAVYLLTILEKYSRNHASAALVVSPTRELAVQIEEDARLLSAGFPDYRIGCFYGGVGYKEQNEELSSGLNLYVGTPGRLLDFAKSNKLDFRCFDTVVLDEADRMFDMGFYPDVQSMFAQMVSPKERQTMLFSATLSTKVRNLAWQYMADPEEIAVNPEEITVKAITQELFHVTKDEKFGLLLSILKKVDPASCLIFTNTKDRAVEVAKRLVMNGYKAEYLMGDMPQSKRLRTLEKMKEGKLPYLVATDVAARGLQIDDLELVVNYDIPEDFESYVHRIGRTARAGKSGKAITLACEEYIYGLEPIENYIQMKIPVLWPDEAGLEPVEDKSEGYHYRSRRPSSKRTERSGERRRSGDRKPQGQRKRSSQGRGRSSHPDDKEYEKLSTMSLEERMVYYRNEFGGDGGKQPPKEKAAQKPQQKTQQKRRPQQQGPKPQQKRPGQEKKKPQPSKPQSEAVKQAPAKPMEGQNAEVRSARKGIFARIKAKIFGEK